jgi:hypothetical protein
MNLAIETILPEEEKIVSKLHLEKNIKELYEKDEKYYMNVFSSEGILLSVQITENAFWFMTRIREIINK